MLAIIKGSLANMCSYYITATFQYEALIFELEAFYAYDTCSSEAPYQAPTLKILVPIAYFLSLK